MEYYSLLKKMTVPSGTKWVDLHMITLSKNKSESERKLLFTHYVEYK